MILRSGRQLPEAKMPGSPNPGAAASITHSYIHVQSGVTPFCGRVNGFCEQSVETFIRSVDTALSQKKLTDPGARFVEATSYLQGAKGDIGLYMRSMEYRECTTWEDLQILLRAAYGQKETGDLIRDFSEVLRLVDRKGVHLLSYMATVTDAVMDFAPRFFTSDWVNNGMLSKEAWVKFTSFAILMAGLPKVVVDNFDTPLTFSSGERLFRELVQKNLCRLEVVDSTLLIGGLASSRKEASSSSVGHCLSIDRPLAVKEDFKAKHRSSSPSKGTDRGPSINCFNCGKSGHIKTNCNVRYCGYHESYDHNYKECLRRKPTKFSQKSSQRGGGDRNRNHSKSPDKRKSSPRPGTSQGKQKGSPKVEAKEAVNAISSIVERGQEKPVVAGKCMGLDLFVFFDSGATTNLISFDTYQELFSSLPLSPSGTPVCDIHRRRLQTVGVIKLCLEVGDRQFTESVLVVKGIILNRIVLIGHQACKTHDIVIKPKLSGVSFGSDGVLVPYVENSGSLTMIHGVDFDEYFGDSEQGNCFKGVAAHDFYLEPGVIAPVKLMVKGADPGSELLIVPDSERLGEVAIVVSLHTVTNDHVTVEIQNGGESPRMVKRGTYVVDLEPVSGTVSEDVVEGCCCLTLDPDVVEKRSNIFKEKLGTADHKEFVSNVISLLEEFPDVVAVKGDSLGVTDVLEHHIQLEEGTRPIYIPSYRLPMKTKNEIEAAVEEWEKEGIVRKSSSPFNFPLLAVKKKDGSTRVCVDFRRLNDVTVKDRYPVACLPDLFAEIGSKKFFSSVDLLQGFLQVPVQEGSRPLTAFSTPRGHFEFNRMPFGLCGSPITFTRMVNTVFHGMLGVTVHAYMDDLLVASDTIEEHIEVLREVFRRLRVAGLKIKLSKCDFLKRNITYLGHVISHEGIQVNDAKVKAIEGFPIPTTRKGVRQFLGMASFFRRFIKDFSSIAAPLTELTKESVSFSWGERENAAFEKLKQSLVSAPVLRFPDFDLPFVLVTDASQEGLGSCLMQKVDQKFHPIAYFSRKWRSKGPDERLWSVIDKEAYAVVASLKHFRYVLQGYPVTVFTDHKPLLELFNKPDLSPKRSRWFLTIQDFSPEIKYIEGKSNVVADALSRNIEGGSEGEVCLLEGTPIEWDAELVARKQDEDPVFGPAKRFLRGEVVDAGYKLPVADLELQGDLLVRRARYKTRRVRQANMVQLVVPKSLVPEVLRIIHASLGGDHCGVDRSYDRAREKYFWVKMFQDIKDYVRSCHVCNACKPSPVVSKRIALYPVPSCPFETVHMDLLTNFSETPKGNKHLLVVVDELTRFTEVLPVRNKTAEEVGVVFFNKFICRYGVPTVLVSDNGREFVNKFFDTLASLLKIKKVTIQPYRPEANGLVERTNRKILEALRMTVGGQDPTWDRLLDYVQFSLNAAVHSSIGMSPHEALFGVKVREPFDLLTVPKGDETLSVLLSTAKERFEKLRSNLRASSEAMVDKVNSSLSDKKLSVGDIVYVKVNVRNQLNYKLSPKFEGPFEVVKELVGNNYKVWSREHDFYKSAHISQLKIIKTGSSEGEALVLRKPQKVRFAL